MSELAVYVVDGDDESRKLTCDLVQSLGFSSRGFGSADEFVAVYRDEAGCVVVDCPYGGSKGLDLQGALQQCGFTIPVVIVTASARTPLTVQAVKQGVANVLDKPVSAVALAEALRDGLATDRKLREMRQSRLQVLQRIDSLASREVEVLKLLVNGYANKEMAAKLSVSLRTIENRRRQIFSKVGVRSVAELVKTVISTRADRPHLLQPPIDSAVAGEESPFDLLDS